MAIVSAIVFASSTYFLRRDRANAAVAELAGWLEALSSRAGSVGPCTVKFKQGNLLPGATFASLVSKADGADNDSDPRCTTTPNLALPAIDGARSYSVDFAPVSQTTVVFTPRAGVAAISDDVIVKISVNGDIPLRCLKISFGTISIGVNNTTASTSETCTVWEKT